MTRFFFGRQYSSNFHSLLSHHLLFGSLVHLISCPIPLCWIKNRNITYCTFLFQSFLSSWWSSRTSCPIKVIISFSGYSVTGWKCYICVFVNPIRILLCCFFFQINWDSGKLLLYLCIAATSGSGNMSQLKAPMEMSTSVRALWCLGMYFHAAWIKIGTSQ